MEPARFALGTRIAAPRERVYRELADPARHLGLQPLLVAVEERAAGAEGGRAFDAIERIRLLGVLPVRNRIHVEIVPVSPPERIDFHAHSPLGPVSVRSRFTLVPEGAGACTVREEVEVGVAGWLALLRGAIVGQATRAQEGLLRSLRLRLETGDPGSGESSASS